MTSLYQFRHHIDEGTELPCFVLNKILSPENCDDTVEELKDKVTVAQHQHENKLELSQNSDIRDSGVHWFNNPNLSNIIRGCVDIVNYESGWQYDIRDQETFQFTKYKKDQHYGWHTDGHGCHKSARKSANLHNNDTLQYTRQTNLLGTVRKISVSAILNEDYEGGELQFKTLTPMGKVQIATVKGNKGDVIVFPSYINHRVTPVTKGTRYSIVAWYGGPPFK